MEKYFGEYPWAKEKIGVCQTPFAGMEHQTMIAYGNLFRYDNSDSMYDGLLFHEFSHEWWGNKVTCKNWADMWIHEGIATFCEALYQRETQGIEAYNKIWGFWKFAGLKPIVLENHPTIREAYNGHVYSKGAYFMHMLQTVVGDSIFFSALKKLVNDTSFGKSHLVTTDDVEQLFSRQYKSDLKPFFDLFLKTNRELKIIVKRRLSMNQIERTYTIQLLNKGVSIPVDILTDDGSKRLNITESELMIKSKVFPEIDASGYYLKKVIYE